MIKNIWKSFQIHQAKEYQKKDERGKIESFMPEFGHVYAFEMSNDTVKIGYSGNVPQRAMNISNGSGLQVLHIHQTAKVQIETAKKIERQCHLAFVASRTHGEFFAISYEEACAELDKYADFIAADNKRLREEIIPARRKKYEESIAELLKDAEVPPSDEYNEISARWEKIKTAEALIQAAELVDDCDIKNAMLRDAAIIMTGKDYYKGKEYLYEMNHIVGD